MKRYLVDMPTMTSYWITALSEEEAMDALYIATKDVELRIEIGDDQIPIEVINFTCRGEPDLIDVEGDEDEDEDEDEF